MFTDMENALRSFRSSNGERLGRDGAGDPVGTGVGDGDAAGAGDPVPVK
jgi:hypothetical protein